MGVRTDPSDLDPPLLLPGLAVAIVNFNTAELALRAAVSARAYAGGPVLIVDNASRPASARQLAENLPPGVRLCTAGSNLGFAGGNNLAFGELLGDPGWSHVLLLNSDAELTPGFAVMWREVLASGAAPDLTAARVDAPAAAANTPARIDSLGMVLHRSLIASNRHSTSDPLFGPTGALAVLSRGLIERFREIDGDVFPAEFFCYAEDTDLCARARLRGVPTLWLGDAVAAVHVGQASSAGPGSEFVAYHGLRNSLWMMLRCIPGTVLLRCLPWVLLAQLGILVKYLRQRRLGLLLRIWRDTFRSFPRLLRERRAIQETRSVSSTQFLSGMSASFYDRDYVRREWRDLFRRKGITEPGSEPLA